MDKNRLQIKQDEYLLLQYLHLFLPILQQLQLTTFFLSSFQSFIISSPQSPPSLSPSFCWHRSVWSLLFLAPLRRIRVKGRERERELFCSWCLTHSNSEPFLSSILDSLLTVNDLFGFDFAFQIILKATIEIICLSVPFLQPFLYPSCTLPFGESGNEQIREERNQRV